MPTIHPGDNDSTAWVFPKHFDTTTSRKRLQKGGGLRVSNSPPKLRGVPLHLGSERKQLT